MNIAMTPRHNCNCDCFSGAEDEQWPEDLKLLNYVVENNIDAVAAELKAGADVNMINAEVCRFCLSIIVALHNKLTMIFCFSIL